MDNILWKKSDFIVDKFKDLPKNEIDTQYLTIEKLRIPLLKGILATENILVTEEDLMRLTSNVVKDLTLSMPLQKDQIEDIWNLNEALSYLERNFTNPLDEKIIKQYNEFVIPNYKKKYGGQIRKTNVQISGTTYKPPDFQNLPRIVDNFRKEIELVEGSINKAITIFLFISKNQIFLDGNKRTGILSAIHELLNGGQPSLQLQPEETIEMLIKLKLFHEEGNNEEVTDFIYSRIVKEGK